MGYELHVYSDDSSLSVGPAREGDNNAIINHLKSMPSGSLIIPKTWPVEPRVMSRFLAKTALEILVERLMSVPDWEDALIHDQQFDPLRRYARIGDAPKLWPYYSRQIHDEDALVQDEFGNWQILHEYTLLYTEYRELYAVICIFGIEYAINLVGPAIEGYETWVATHNGKSPLYPGSSAPPV